MVKNPPANAADVKNRGSCGRSLEEGMATHPNSVQAVIEGPPLGWNGITGGDYCLISLVRILSSVPTSD